jgi:hypothetical protein
VTAVKVHMVDMRLTLDPVFKITRVERPIFGRAVVVIRGADGAEVEMREGDSYTLNVTILHDEVALIPTLVRAPDALPSGAA